MSTMSDLHYCINEARRIKRSLGTRTAAGYLRNQGVDLSLALAFLVGPRAQPRPVLIWDTRGYTPEPNYELMWAMNSAVVRNRRDRRAS